MGSGSSPPRSRPPLDGKDKRPSRSSTRRTEALNSNHSSTAPGSDGVRPPFLTVAVTGVPSANSGHYSAIPGAVAPLWEPAAHCANVRGAAPSTVLPTPCTSYSIRPLYPHDSGENNDFHTPLLMYTAPPYDYKRRRRASSKGDGHHHLGRFRDHPHTSTTLSTRYWHSPLSASPLAEVWELPSLSRLACTPYYRHLRYKII